MKKNILLLSVGILLICVVGLIFFTSKKSPATTPRSPTPTPRLAMAEYATPTDPPALKDIRILSVRPENTAIEVTVDERIDIQFSAPPPDSTVFAIAPYAPFTQRIQGQLLQILFTKPLSPGTTYTWRIGYTDAHRIEQSYTFTTVGPTPAFLPNTAPTGMVQDQNETDKVSHPDIFLANQTPYANNLFSITSAYTSIPRGHYFFTIESAGTTSIETAKQSATEWMKSLGVTDSQIEQLDLQYRGNP